MRRSVSRGLIIPEPIDTRRRLKLRHSHEVSYVIACFMPAGCFCGRRIEVPDGGRRIEVPDGGRCFEVSDEGRLACRYHEASVAASPLQPCMDLPGE
jgi:hypothetical protein